MGNEMTIAAEILNQLGNNKFIAMVGAKNMLCGSNCLIFKFMKNSSKTNRVKITLNSMDTYDMMFFSINNKFEIINKREVNGVYADMLTKVFESETGLYTRL